VGLAASESIVAGVAGLLDDAMGSGDEDDAVGDSSNVDMALSTRARWQARRILPSLRSLQHPLEAIERFVDAGGSSTRGPHPAEGVARRGAVVAAQIQALADKAQARLDAVLKADAASAHTKSGGKKGHAGEGAGGGKEGSDEDSDGGEGDGGDPYDGVSGFALDDGEDDEDGGELKGAGQGSEK